MPSDPKLKEGGSVFESITGGSSRGSGTVKNDYALILPIHSDKEDVISHDEPSVSPAPVVNHHHHPLTEIVISAEANQKISEVPQRNDAARITCYILLTMVAGFLILSVVTLFRYTIVRIVSSFEGKGQLLAWIYILFGYLINRYSPLEKRSMTGLNNGCKEELKNTLHYIIALLSFLFYGLIPILVYIFTFRETDDKDLKVLAAAGATFPGFALLVILKAHFQKSEYWKDCAKVVLFYLTFGVLAFGLPYLFHK